jgi:hypothetical protein
MGRWKKGSDGLPYYDEQDSGPDQVTPPQQQPPAQSASPLIAGAQQDWPTNYLPPAPAAGNWIYPQGNPATPQTQTQAPSGAGDPRRDTVAAWYKDLLGREGSEQEYGHWAGLPGDLGQYRQNIANSPEAQQYRSRPQQAVQPQAQPQQAPQAGGMDPGAFGRAWMASGGRTVQDLQNFIAANPQYGGTMTGSKGDKVRFASGQEFDAVLSAGLGGHGASWQPLGAGGGYGGPAPSSMMAQFSDPLTQQYERMLQAQTGLYQTQQGQMQEQAARATQTRAATEAAVKQLTDFLQQRVGQLQQPAYTGAEAETIKTRALEPIEQDRAAAKQRALLDISRRGHGEMSGTLTQSMNDVDRGFDQSRAGVHNEMGYRQVTEERSRQQEAQGLMQMLAQLPDAVARGDLEFVNRVTQLINQPGQQGLATSALLADLPVQRTQLGLQVLGAGGSPMSAFGGAASLLQNSQQQSYLDSQQRGAYLQGLGQLLGYML